MQIVDIALLTAAVLVGLDAVTGRRALWVPKWIGIAAALILILATLHMVLPTPTSYLSSRFTLLYNEAVSAAQDGTAATFMVAVRWCIALVALPVVIAYLGRLRPSWLPLVGAAWVTGAAVNSAASVTDWLGVTDFALSVVGVEGGFGRQVGLSSHPNNLGFACVIVVPLALWMFRRWPRTAILSILLLAAGAMVSGSRGAQVGFVLVFLVCAMVLRLGRAAIWWTLLVGLVAVFALIQYAPGVLDDISSVIRFDGANFSGQSDAGRSLLAAQAEHDFTNYPLAGVGLGVLTHAHSVPLQLAASGGILLIVAVVIYWAGALITGIRLRGFADGITLPAAVSVTIWLVMSVVQNQLVDRYLYVSVAIIATVAAIQHFTPESPTPQAPSRGARVARRR